METKKKRRSRKSKSKGVLARQPGEISERTVEYTGPVKFPNSNQSTSLKTIHLSYVTQLVSSGGGAIVTAIDKDPSAVAPEWPGLVSVFDEYRVLAMQLHYVPRNQYQSGATLMPALVVAIDHDDATIPPTFASVYTKESAKLVNVANEWWITWRMFGIENSIFADCNVPATGKGSIKIYNCGTFDNTRTYGDFILNWLVQFKGVD